MKQSSLGCSCAGNCRFARLFSAECGVTEPACSSCAGVLLLLPALQYVEDEALEDDVIWRLPQVELIYAVDTRKEVRSAGIQCDMPALAMPSLTTSVCAVNGRRLQVKPPQWLCSTICDSARLLEPHTCCCRHCIRIQSHGVHIF